MYTRFSWILLVLALFTGICSAVNLTLEYRYIFHRNKTTQLVLQNETVIYWVENQTQTPRTALYTKAWIFEPDTNRTGYRYSNLRVSFLSDCKDAMTKSNNTKYPIKFLIYPYSYATVSPELGSEYQDLPVFCEEVNLRSFNKSSYYSKNYSSGELFIGFRGTVKYATDPATKEVVLLQYVIPKCTIMVEAFGSVTMVSSLTLFYGILVLILVPAFITIIAHFIMLICQNKESEKSEASFKRVTYECRLFWIVWIASFAIFIGVVLIPIY